MCRTCFDFSFHSSFSAFALLTKQFAWIFLCFACNKRQNGFKRVFWQQRKKKILTNFCLRKKARLVSTSSPSRLILFLKLLIMKKLLSEQHSKNIFPIMLERQKWEAIKKRWRRAEGSAFQCRRIHLQIWSYQNNCNIHFRGISFTEFYKFSAFDYSRHLTRFVSWNYCCCFVSRNFIFRLHSVSSYLYGKFSPSFQNSEPSSLSKRSLILA